MDPSKRVNSFANLDCRDRSNDSGDCIRGTNSRDPDRSSFYQELVNDGGVQYYHVIVGDPAEGFAIEYFIRSRFTDPNVAQFGWFSAAPYNASSGSVYNGGQDTFPRSSFAVDPLSASNPDDPFRSSGNASGNPKRVIFRQVVLDPEMQQEVLKASFATKPKITQTVTDAQIQSTFVLDMSGINYDDMDSVGTLTNKLVLMDPNTPGNTPLVDFDMSRDGQITDVTGGRYRYNPGTDFDQSYGSYTYFNGGFDVYKVDWASYSAPTNVPNTVP